MIKLDLQILTILKFPIVLDENKYLEKGINLWYAQAPKFSESITPNHFPVHSFTGLDWIRNMWLYSNLLLDRLG